MNLPQNTVLGSQVPDEFEAPRMKTRGINHLCDFRLVTFGTHDELAPLGRWKGVGRNVMN